MILRACRYFGSTPDYWWGRLTWALHVEMSKQLAEEPPADRLIAVYFAANKWWTPPSLGDAADEEPGEWQSPYPDVTD